MESIDVITFGEAMSMFIANQSGPLSQVEHFTRSLAGAETNVSIGLSRLGYKVGYVSKVGNDAFGEFIIDVLQQEGVDTSKISIDDSNPTGFQLKAKVSAGDPQVQYFRRGSAASTLSTTNFHADYFAKARHLHMTGIPPALSKTALEFAEYALAWMKSNHKSISFDPNLRPRLWSSTDDMVRVINQLAVQADVVLPGISEGEILTGFSAPRDIAAFYLERGVKLTIIKLGVEGAYYRTAEAEGVVKGYPVREVVDTVGAGDGFAVGVISGLLDGVTLLEAIERGNAIGAMAVMSPGDMEGLPSQVQLNDFIKLHKETDAYLFGTGG